MSEMQKYYLGQEWVPALYCLCQQSEKLTLKHLDLYKFCKMFIVYALKPVTFLLESSEGYVDQKW